MNGIARTYLTSGIAALGVGVIALSPVQPVPHQLAAAQQHAVIENLGVNLAAAIDPITPLISTISTSLANITHLTTLAFQQPFPFASTILANVGTYINELLTGNAGLIPSQIINNIKTFFQAPMDIGDTLTLPATNAVPYDVVVANPFGVTYVTETKPAEGNPPAEVNSLFVQVYAGDLQACNAPGADPCFYQKVAPITNFMNSHASGLLLGLLGPILSPVLQLGNSVRAIVDSLKTGDVLGAINSLINIPTNVVNAFLNGVGPVDVTGLIAKFANIPDSIKEVDLNLGGLLTVMPQNGSLYAPDANPPTVYGGGVAMDSLGLVTEFGRFAYGIPTGFIGSIIGTGQFIAQQMRVTAPGAASAKAARAAAPAAAEAAPAESAGTEAPSASDTREAVDAVDAPSAGTSQAPADTPAPARGTSRAKASAGKADSHSGARARRGAA